MKQLDSKKIKKGTPMDAALNFLGYRARTVREMERHLDEKQFGEYEVYQVVEKLKDYGYLDDERFAADFVASRLRIKPVSRRKLMQDLALHELSHEVIDNAVAAVTDEMEEENAYLVASKYYESYKDEEPYERKTIIARRLVSRGFNYDTAKTVIERLEREHFGD